MPLQMLLFAAAVAGQAPAPPPPLEARTVVERQLEKRPTRPAPPLSAEEAAQIQARYLARMGAKLEPADRADYGHEGVR